MGVSFDQFVKSAGGTSNDVQVVGNGTIPKPQVPQSSISPVINTITKPAQEAVKGLADTYGLGDQNKSIVNKLSQDVQAGAQDIQNGHIVKGVAKTALRTAGDTAGLIYAPVGAAIQATGLNKVFDYLGELSQKGGKYNPLNMITDMKSVQDFVGNRPNLEEDFGRAMNIGLGALDKGKIEPSTLIERTKAQFTSNLSKAQSEFKPNGAVDGTMKTYENLIKSGQAQPTDIYTNLDTKTYNPEIAKHIISDGKNTLIERGFRGLADQYEKSFTDINNVTPEQVLQNGVKVTSGTPLSGVGAKIAKGTTGAIAKDILPTMDRIVNHQVTQALDLTQGDVKNISESTGHDVGRFMADKNLIGLNKDATLKNVKDFYQKNYDEVRTEIGKVDKVYTPDQIPRYKESLTQIQKQILDVPGLEKANAEVKSLLEKKNLTLNDVQRAKELMDEHFSLYKATGDVQQNVVKGGLANIRSDLKNFIEQQVQQTTGADIKDLNNSVATARSIADAIETRSTRSLTRSNLKLGDLGVFGVGAAFGGPLTGLAFLLGKKIIDSPSFKLKFSKFLDGVSDARKLQIQKDLQRGIIPKEVKVIQSVSKDSNSSIQKDTTTNGSKTAPTTSLKKDFIIQDSKTAKIIDTVNKTSKRTIDNTIPQKKGIIQRAVDKYKSIPNKQGGFLSIGGKVFKEIPEATKREMVGLIDYLNLKKPFDNSMETSLSSIQSKYNINPNWSSNKIADTLANLIEQTKTK